MILDIKAQAKENIIPDKHLHLRLLTRVYCHHVTLVINESINESMNQSINQSLNQLIEKISKSVHPQKKQFINL